MTDTPGEIDIYRYDNYREYLRDLYRARKTGSPRKVTYRSFSQQAGFRAPNFLHLVIHGKRNLGMHSIRKLVRMLDLNAREASFFENLVLFNQTTTHEDKLHYFRKLSSLRQRSETKLLDDKQIGLFDMWYYTVVRELMSTEGFQADPDWMAGKLGHKITSVEAREAMDFLINHDFVRQDVSGKWCPDDPQVKTRDRGVGFSVRKFHADMIELGRQSLNDSPNTRHITGMTLSVSMAMFYLIIRKIILFQEEVRQLLLQEISEETLDHVCKELGLNHEEALRICHVAQLNTQFFKMTV